MLVGNKLDLENERGVPTEEGRALAEKLGNCLFYEASAKGKYNVEECFYDLVRSLYPIMIRGPKEKERKKETQEIQNVVHTKKKGCIII